MILRSAAILLACATFCRAAQDCCSPNVLNEGTCIDGSMINLDCRMKFVLDPRADEGEEFRVDQATGHLIYTAPYQKEANEILHGQYCLGKKFPDNRTDIAFVCLDAVDEDTEAVKWYAVRAICGIISIIFLGATLVVYEIVPELKDLQGKCIIHSIRALAFAMFQLCIIQLQTNVSQFLCTFVSFGIYFTFLTTFFWLNIIAFQVWKSSVKPHMMGTDRQWYMIYLVYGYGAPTIFLIITLTAHFVDGSHIKPEMGVTSCWFGGRTAIWAYFYGPISVLLTINVLLFGFSVHALYKQCQFNNALKLKSLKYKVRLYVQLFVIMGIMWIFEVLSAATEHMNAAVDMLWVLTDYLNALQGFFIFLLLVVFRKRALRGLANSKHCCCIPFPSSWKAFEDEEVSEEEGESRLSGDKI